MTMSFLWGRNERSCWASSENSTLLCGRRIGRDAGKALRKGLTNAGKHVGRGYWWLGFFFFLGTMLLFLGMLALALAHVCATRMIVRAKHQQPIPATQPAAAVPKPDEPSDDDVKPAT